MMTSLWWLGQRYAVVYTQEKVCIIKIWSHVMWNTVESDIKVGTSEHSNEAAPNMRITETASYCIPLHLKVESMFHPFHKFSQQHERNQLQTIAGGPGDWWSWGTVHTVETGDWRVTWMWYRELNGIWNRWNNVVVVVVRYFFTSLVDPQNWYQNMFVG